jgi:putative two-component system response regulator
MEKEAIKELYDELKYLLNSIVFVMAEVVESRDEETTGHIDRIMAFVKILTEAMIERDVYSDELNGIDLDAFCHAACFHDVGKITIPINVLTKPGRLTNEEFDIMKAHSLEGKKIIDKIVSRAGGEGEFLRSAKLFAGFHHERWDGKGYPHGFDRLNIPLQGRIMAIVDVYDALISERPYKQPFTPEEAVKIIMDSTGEMFDPLIAELFFEVRHQFEAVK